MAIKGTDLMSTQTGGAGETIQAQPIQSSAPEQFAANIKMPQQAAPQQQAVAPSAPIQEASVEAQAPTQEVVAEQPQATPEQMIQQELGLNSVDSPSGPDPMTSEEMPVQEVSELYESKEPTQLSDGISIATFPSEPVKASEPSLFDLSEDVLAQEGASKVKSLSDGISVFNPDAEKQQQAAETNKEYAGTGIQVGDDGKIKKSDNGGKKEAKNIFGIEPKPDGIYKYPGVDYALKKEGGKWYRDTNGDGKFETVIDGAQRLKLIEKRAYQEEKEGAKGDGTYVMPNNPGFVYKKEDGKWSVDFEGNGNFIDLTKGDVKKRVENLEKNAEPLKSKKLDKVDEVLSGRVGNLTDFNMNTPLTGKGDPVISEGMSFNQAKKDMSAPGEKDERYNPDGTINFGYDPQYAKQKELGLAPTYGKSDGEYLFPNNNNTYKKEDGKWYIKPSGTKDFVPLTKGDVASRIDQLEKRAYQPIKIKDAVGLTKKADLSYKGMLDKSNELLSQYSGNVDDYKKSFDDANNFAKNDLNSIYKENLSNEQKAGLAQYQDQIKKIIGDGTYDTSKAYAVSKVMKDAEAFFESSKEINKKINEAYQSNTSLDRLAFENKRKTYKQDLGTTGIETDSQRLSRETFEATSEMAQFVLDNVEDGKMKYDRKNGGYTFSPNLDPKERKFIEEKLGTYLSEYDKVQNEKYKETSDKIIKLKNDKYLVKENIEKLENRLAYLQKNNEPGQIAVYDELRKQRYTYEKIDNAIDDLELSKGTVFLTEPKKIAVKVASNLSEDAKDVFDSVPSDVSPKQKFDLFYERLQAQNDKIAKDNGIDAEGMSTLSMRLKDLLDWDGYYSLSDAEKRYLKNLATIKQLAPLYYNNDTGITNESAGFWESFMDSLRSTLLPATSAADNHTLQTQAAATQLQKIQEEGFSPDDLLDTQVLDRLERRSTVDSLSLEKMGGMVGTVGGIILPLVVSGFVPSTSLKLITNLEKLLTGVKDASKIADAVTKAGKVYDAAISSTRFGRFLKPAVEQGTKFELAGKLFGSAEDELNFLSGLAGGAASEGFSVLISKLPTAKALEYIQSIFGANTTLAVRTIAKLGKAGGKTVAKGGGETAEEVAQELSSVYRSTDNWKEMKVELENKFGTFDQVQEFVLSSFIMGSAFGLVDGSIAKETLDAMPEAKRNQVLDAMGAVNRDLKTADEAVDEFSDNKIKQKEIVYRTGAPSATGGAKITRETINDTENKQGVSGEERKGEEPKQAEPVAEPSQEAVSPSGVVQEEQAEVKRVYKAEQIAKTLGGKVVGSATKKGAIPNDFDIYLENKIDWKDMRDKMESLGYKSFGSSPVVETNGKKFEGKDQRAFHFVDSKGQKVDVFQEETNEDFSKRMREQSALAEAQRNKAKVKPSMFEDYGKIKNIKNPQEKKAAIDEFNATHNNQYKRAESIDKNFNGIFRSLEKNNLVKKEC